MRTQRFVAAVPKVDLDYPRPFLRATLSRHGRRLDAHNDRYSFLTPASWRDKHWAMKERHDEIHFDRHLHGKGTVFGTGHVASMPRSTMRCYVTMR